MFGGCGHTDWLSSNLGSPEICEQVQRPAEIHTAFHSIQDLSNASQLFQHPNVVSSIELC